MKVLIFRGFYFKDQERIMMINLLKSKEELIEKTLKEYFACAERLFRQKEI